MATNHFLSVKYNSHRSKMLTCVYCQASDKHTAYIQGTRTPNPGPCSDHYNRWPIHGALATELEDKETPSRGREGEREGKIQGTSLHSQVKVWGTILTPGHGFPVAYLSLTTRAEVGWQCM